MTFRVTKNEEEHDDLLGHQSGVKYFVLDGIMGLRVGGFSGDGEGVSQETHISASECDTSDCFQRLGLLARRYKFGKWDSGGEQIFCRLEARN